MSRLAVLLWLFAGLAAAQEAKLTPVLMQLNWHPQADFGGYFAAKAEGLYEKAGLDVTLKPGGPQLNIHQLLAAGQVDFVMGTSVRTMVIRNQGIPIVAVGPFYRALTLDKTAASQGYVTEDGFAFKKLGMAGKSLWLADFGWNPYSSTLDTTDRFIAEKPRVVEAFLKA